MSRGDHRAGTRRRAAIFAAFIVAALGIGQAGIWVAQAAPSPDTAGPPSADGIQPVIADTKSSNNDCGLLGFDHGVSIARNGQVSGGELTVTVTGYNSPTGFADWSSNLPIDAVYVKGGRSGGDLFRYPSGDTGDQDLHTPQKFDGGFYGVSHLAFCWNDVPAQPDVVIDKANDPTGAVAAAGSITYTLTVTNQGDGSATGVEVTDALPAGVSFASATAGCTEASGTVTCSLADVAPGASVDVEITVTVDEETCGTITNRATVAATNETGGALENDSSNEATNVVECEQRVPPDLRVSKSSDADGPLRDGDAFTYTITVTNVGGETASGVKVHDDLPAGLDVLIAPLPSFQGDPCTVASSVVLPDTPVATIDCGPAALDAGASADVTIKVRVNGDGCGPITNVVDVQGANEPTENAGPDNHAESSDEIACVPKIHLLKRGPSLAHVGDTITYVFAATNHGGTDLTDIALTDEMCDGTPTLVDDGDGDTTLAVAETWEYACEHTISAGDGDPVHNEATVTGSDESGTVSDSATYDVDVIHPDIAIEKSASPTSGPAGTTIEYTYVVTNTGDTTLHDIAVVDDILGLVGEIPVLAPGASAQLTMRFTLGSSPVTNVGTATGSDVLGRSVSASDEVSVTVVSAGEGGVGGADSPFTGSDVGGLAAITAFLAVAGLVSVAFTRRRREASD